VIRGDRTLLLLLIVQALAMGGIVGLAFYAASL
jgi:hypothetical protein